MKLNWIIPLFAAAGLVLAGCGGGGSSSNTPAAPAAGGGGGGGGGGQTQTTPVSLGTVTTGGAGYEAPAATGDTPLEIKAGMSATSGSVTFMCAEDGDDCTVMVADDGTVTSTGGTVTAMNSEAFQASLDNAAALSKETVLRAKVGDLQPIAGAVDAAGSALMKAKKYAALIGTEKSDGDSLMAKNNAAMVLKAQSDLKAAIDAAKMARTEAMTAKDALGEDGDADVIDTLDAAITDANTKIAAAEEILNGTALAGYVETVTGDDEDDVKTPTYRGELVAKAVAGALGPTVPEGGSPAANGAGNRVIHFPAAAPTDATADTAMTVGVRTPTGSVQVRAAANPVAKANKYEAISRHLDSKTWEMIVGDGVMEKAVNNVPTKVASWDSEMVALVRDRSAAISTADGAYTSVTTGIEVSYMGIPGTAWCLGTDCEVESTGTGADLVKMLTGSWYFAPLTPTAHYKKAADAEVYSADTMFATYGHWLVVDDGSGTATNAGQVHVLTYAYAPTFDTTNGAAIWGEKVSGRPASEQATYTGMAVGRSVHKVSDKDVDITEIHSGRFEATVELTAKFGAAPMLGGTVSGFMSDNPDAVDSSWEVTLKETAVDIITNIGTVADGVTEATGQDGTWSAASYGGTIDDGTTADVDEFRRPDGIYGGFNAHFTDGHVAGAYATRND